MTERSPRRESAPGSAAGSAERSSAGPAPARAWHPLLGAFPLAVMVLSTFLVVFSLMMARLTVVPAPSARGGSQATLIAGAGGAIRTRASGASAGAPAGASPSPQAGAVTGAGAVVTRTSGAVGIERDD